MSNQSHVLEFRWSVSHGRDTYGYNICSLYVDGRKVSSCNGGGYDMQGTALAEWFSKTHQEELLTIATRAHTHRNLIYKQSKTNAEHNALYGMSALYGRENSFYRPDENPNPTPYQVTLDSGCGMSSMERILNALGYTLRFVSDNGKRGSTYLMEQGAKE